MDTVKLINKNGDIIERLKIQYERNEKIWNQRGWKVYDETIVVKEPIIEEAKVDTEWQPEEKPKKKKSKKKGK